MKTRTLLGLVLALCISATAFAATINGGGSGSSTPGAGGANAVQGSNGSGTLTDTGCTATGSAMTCANGFIAGSGGTIGNVDLLEGTAPGANATAAHHNLYMNSATSALESHENGGAAKLYGWASAAMTAGRCVQVASGGGTQVEAASAACGAGGTAGSPLFVQTASATAVTAAAETTILSTGVGSKTIPVNWFTAAGTVMDVRFSGKYSTGAVPGTLQIKLKFGATVVAQTVAFTPLTSVTDGIYSGFIRLIARTVGATGTIFVADGLFTTGSTLTPGEIIFSNPTLGTAVTIDTTATQVLDITATWGTGATNSITGYTFEMVGPGSAVSSVFGRTGAVVAAANDYSASQLSGLGTGVATALGVNNNSAGGYSPIDGTATLTNKTLDAEGTGNVITVPRRLWFPAAGCSNATAGPIWDVMPTTGAVAACITGTNTQKGVLDFADGATVYQAQVTHRLPSTWTGTVDANIKWLTTAIAGDVVWQLATICVADAETDDPAFNTASTVTDAAKGTTNQTNDAAITTVTVTGCAASELMHVKIFRDPAHASDTLAATARLIGVELVIREAL